MMEIEPSDWIALVGVLTSTAVAIAMLVFNMYLTLTQRRREDVNRRDQQQREDDIRRAAEERMDALRLISRQDKPQVEFTVECRFVGADSSKHLTEVRIIAHNKGNVIQRFSRIGLWIRGIRRSQAFALWVRNEKVTNRAIFPEVILKEENIIPQPDDGESMMTYFAEPGIRQTFSFVTLVSSEFKHILVHADFDYHDERRKAHNCEGVFPVPALNGKHVE
jgi:hypothetical protein